MKKRKIDIVLKVLVIFFSLSFCYFLFISFYYKSPHVDHGKTEFSKRMAKEFSGKIAVLQNLTTDHQTILTILREGQQTSRKYQVFSENGAEVGFQMRTTLIFQELRVDRLDILDLDVNKTYYLRISDEGRVVDTRQFKSLNFNNKKPVLAVASCSRVGWLGRDFGPVSIWDQLQLQKPDVILFLGDLVYPDTAFQAIFEIKPSLDQIKEKYVETWQTLRLYHQYHLIPLFSVMDDHDYGFQGANSINNKLAKSEVLKLFRTFYPIFEKAKDNVYKPGPGSSFRIDIYGLKLIFLDNKVNRVASGPKKIKGVIWGEEQLTWLTKILSENDSPALIASGTLFTFPVEQEDAAQYETPEEFMNFIKAVKMGNSRVILLSGDVHFSAVTSLPKGIFNFESYEITASRIHSISPSVIPPYFNGYVGREKGQLLHTDEKNFVLLKLEESGSFKNLEVLIYEKDNQTPLKTTLFSK